MDNKLFDANIALPILDALGTSPRELIIVAGAHDILTAQTDEGPAVSFFIPTEYMMNRADNVIVVRHADDTYSVIFYKGKKEVDRIERHAKEQLYEAWQEHTACAIQMPLFVLRFDPGQFVTTRNAHATFYGFEIRHALARHLNGDWGEVKEDSKRLNSKAIKDGSRILSAYTYRGHEMWVITNAEGEDGKRDATTVLLPGDY